MTQKPPANPPSPDSEEPSETRRLTLFGIDRDDLYRVVFEADTPAGRNYDIILLVVILLSVLTVMFDSISEVAIAVPVLLNVLEWTFTILFSLEYVFRLVIAPRPLKYAFSFWGVVDLLSVLPTYLSLLFAGFHYLMIVRVFRLLRVFRILKLVRFTRESRALLRALKASAYKIGIFMFSVTILVTLMGTIMYVIEGEQNGFTSIPQSIYWAVITITTVGYGDIVPVTPIGKFVSALIMLIGYAIIAVPTGIVTVELSRADSLRVLCPICRQANPESAVFCNHCGFNLSKDGVSRYLDPD